MKNYTGREERLAMQVNLLFAACRFNEHFKQLMEIIIQYDIPQREVCKIARISKATYYRTLRSRKIINLDSAERMAKAIAVLLPKYLPRPDMYSGRKFDTTQVEFLP